LQQIHLRHTRDKARAKALRFTSDGKSLAIALVPDSHSGSQVVLWDLENNKERAAVRDCKEDVKKLGFAPDGAVVILMPSSVRVWDPATNQVHREFKGQNPAEQFVTCTLSADGQTLATMCQDKKLRLWRVSEGTCLQTWPVNLDLIRQNGCPFEFSPDGKYLAMRGQGAQFHVWDAKTGKELKVANKGASFENIDVMAFSPDSRLLAWHGNHGPKIVEVAALVAGK
jgi:WD40 repeat protein